MAGRTNAPKGTAWHGDSDEYCRKLNGYEAVIVKDEAGRRAMIFSIYEPTVNLRNETFKTLKAAKAYVDDILENEPAQTLRNV